MNGEHEPKRLKLNGDGSKDHEENKNYEENTNHEENTNLEEITKEDSSNHKDSSNHEDSSKHEENSKTEKEKHKSDEENGTDDNQMKKTELNETAAADSSNLRPIAGPSTLKTDSIKSKEVATSSNIPAIVDRSNGGITSQIFKMDVDCFNELFNYLSFKDLLSLAKTCKTLLGFVGDYYKRYFAYRNYEVQHNGIYTDCALTLAVKQLITRLQFRFCSFRPLYRINSHIEQFSSLNHITFSNMDLMEPDYDRIQRIFHRIESMNLRSCLPEFCNKCMDLCGNLKRISMRHITPGAFLEQKEFPFLFRTYPKLEYFEITLLREWPIEGLNGFLEQNPNIRTFATSGLCLWINRDQFLNSKVKLDILEVRMMEVYGVELDEFSVVVTRMQTICRLINELFNRGFFKRLHFFITDDQQITNIYELVRFRGLEKLCIVEFKQSYSLHPLTLVKELVIINGIENLNLTHLAEQCTKLERLYLGVRTNDDILPFIRFAPKLSKISLLPKRRYRFDKPIQENLLVMSYLEKKREMVPTARKLTIYVPDHIYVKTKWTTRNGDVNLKSVELRRGEADYDDFVDNEIN